MRIKDFLREDFIIEELVSSNKEEVLQEISRTIRGEKQNFQPAAMVKVLLEREKLGSTGIGDSIAIPHGKLNGLDELIVAFGRSRQGVDFNAVDGKPVKLFFLLIAPESSRSEHLKVLARISRMLKDLNFRNSLMAATSRNELFQIIAEKDERT